MAKCTFPSIIASIILLCIVTLVVLLVTFKSSPDIKLTPIVETSYGPIQGKFVNYQGTNVAHFLGIPFAKPPTGSLRFQLPVEPDDWTEVKSTINYGSPCSQRSANLLLSDEDCLFINVYVTESTLSSSNNDSRPVLFWIHGGALATGAGNEYYHGIPMVPLHDVILVTFNYRLNAFGFAYFGEKESIPPNIGLMDQRVALEWTHKNIAAFGGNPDLITIFGESAGSMSVSAHILSPLSKGLFKRAILESGTLMLPVEDPDFHIENAWTMVSRTSCASSQDLLKCLQDLPASDIINAQSDGPLRFRWFYGDDFLPNSPSETFSKGLYDYSHDILLGVEKNEFTMFMAILNATLFNPSTEVSLDYQTAIDFLSLIFKPESMDFYKELYFGSYANLTGTELSNYLLKQLEKAYSDTILVCPTYMFGQKYLTGYQDSGNVYGYYHTQKPFSCVNSICDNSPWLGVCHGADLTFVFGLPLVKPGAPQKDIDLALEVMKIWAHFAEFGQPPSVNGTQWKSLKQESTAMILNMDQLGQVEHDRIEFCLNQWDGFVQNGISNFTYLMSAV